MIPGLKLGRGLNTREHPLARKRRVENERTMTRLFMREVYRRKPGETIPLPSVITITSCRRGKLDDDNLAGACKSVRDEVAKQLGLDDGDGRLHWRYKQLRGQPWSVRVEFLVGHEPVEIFVQVPHQASKTAQGSILGGGDGS